MTLRCFWSFFNHFFETCLIFTFSTWWPLATVVRFRPEGACVQLSELRWWSGPKMPLFCRLVWSLIQRLECIYDIYVPNVTEFRKGPKTQVFIQTLKMVQQFQRMAWLTHDALLILLKSSWSPRSALPVWAVTSTSLPSSTAGMLCLGRIGRRLGEGCFDIDHRHILSHHMRHEVDTPLIWTYYEPNTKTFSSQNKKERTFSHLRPNADQHLTRHVSLLLGQDSSAQELERCSCNDRCWQLAHRVKKSGHMPGRCRQKRHRLQHRRYL